MFGRGVFQKPRFSQKSLYLFSKAKEKGEWLGGVKYKKEIFYMQGDETYFFQLKAQHCPENELIKI